MKWEHLSLVLRWKKPTFGEGYWLTRVHGKELKGWSEIWQEIDGLGREGWELVTILSTDTAGGPNGGYTMTGVEYWFKRPIRE